MNHFLRVDKVVKQYANCLALDEVSMEVPENSIYGLLGPNGAGKTTLIRIINQITGPDKGVITLNGKPLEPEDVARIGYLPEERGLYKKMKVGEQALYLAQLKGMSRQEALKSLKKWFEKFEIQTWWDKKVEELSKGMQQKVQFITTVIHSPELLIFDEPFSGFDPINTNLLKNEIKELRQNGATILFSTHNMASVEELCDHITLINKSKSILDGEVNTIKHSHKLNQVRIDYTGDEENINKNLPNGCSIINHSNINGYSSVTVQMVKELSVNELLTKLLNKIQIHGVQELLPTMNEIFINLVENSNNNL